jgi:hypothetical protein
MYFYHETLFSTKRQKLYVRRSFKNYLTTAMKLPSFFFFFFFFFFCFFRNMDVLFFLIFCAKFSVPLTVKCLTTIYEHGWIGFQLFKTKSLFPKYGVKYKIYPLGSKCIYKDKMSKPIINSTRKNRK